MMEDLLPKREDLSLFQADAFELLASLESGSVNCVVVDYPYESLEKHRKIGTTTRLSHSTKSSNDWFGTVPNSKIQPLLKEFERVMAKNSHLYMFCDDETSNFIWAQNKLCGSFKWWKRIVWDKQKMGMGYHYRARYEFIAFMEKGKRRLNDLGICDVLACPRVRGGYPTEKPVPLIETLIQQSTSPGDLVLDPFCGSGSTLVASARTGRRAIGGDIAFGAISTTMERIQGI